MGDAVTSISQLHVEGRRAWGEGPDSFCRWTSTALSQVSPGQWEGLLRESIGVAVQDQDWPSPTSYQQATSRIISSLFRSGDVGTGYQLLIYLSGMETEQILVPQCQDVIQMLTGIATDKEIDGEIAVALGILEVVFELDPCNITVLDKLVRHRGYRREWLLVDLYIEAFVEWRNMNSPHRSSAGSESSIDRKDSRSVSLLAFLLENNRHKQFFDLFISLVSDLDTEAQAPFYAWLTKIARHFLPDKELSIEGLWEPHHLLEPIPLGIIQGLIGKAGGTGFFLMAQALEDCAQEIQLGNIVSLNLTQELAHLSAISNSMRYYSISGDIEKVRTLMPEVLNHWSTNYLKTISTQTGSLIELKLISTTFLFTVCNLLTYLCDARSKIRSYLHISADSYSEYAKQRYVEAAQFPANLISSVEHGIRQSTIRVGYLGECLRRHSVGFLSHHVIGSHDVEKVSTYCYQVGTQVDSLDDINMSFRDNAYCYRDLCGESVEAIVKKIRNDSLDILVFLDGLYIPDNIIIPALRVSPIQISWLGSDSPGLSEIDYCLVDPYLLPKDAQKDYREKLIRLPNFLAVNGFNAAEVDEQRFRDLLNISADDVIFGSSAYAAKRSPECVEAQLDILRAVPNSVLLIKGVGDLSRVTEIYKDKLNDPETEKRLRFITTSNTAEHYRAQLGAWDLVLDTFPYTGATHTVEALYMGVPVLTKVGEHYFGRMSFSLLKQIDLDDCICWSVEEYVEKGIQMGRCREYLDYIKQRIRASYSTSRLWNANQLARHLEKVYRYLLTWRPDYEVTMEHLKDE